MVKNDEAFLLFICSIINMWENEFKIPLFIQAKNNELNK
jgi:hypothetical protein